MNRLRMEGSASIEAARFEIKRIERELDALPNLILEGGAADKITTKMVQLESRKAELEQALIDAEEPPPLLYTRWQKAGEVLRSLVKEIVLIDSAFTNLHEGRQSLLPPSTRQ
jgi:site-specific DNA recombinase